MSGAEPRWAHARAERDFDVLVTRPSLVSARWAGLLQHAPLKKKIICYPGIIVGYCCVYLKISWDIQVCGLVWALAAQSEGR